MGANIVIIPQFIVTLPSKSFIIQINCVSLHSTNQTKTMKTNYELRYAAHPDDARHYDTQRLRRDFLIETPFGKDTLFGVFGDEDLDAVFGASATVQRQKQSVTRYLDNTIQRIKTNPVF
jgi:hypothetical protein